MKSRVAVLAAAVVVCAACATFSPPLEQRTSQGPTARQFWTLRMMLANAREPSLDERRHWEDQLELRIRQYMQQHPDAANALHRTAFTFDKRAVVGMTKEQVLILLGPPDGLTTDAAQMEKLARRYWPDLRGNVTEAWVYPLGWNFFFMGPRLAEITQYLERD